MFTNQKAFTLIEMLIVLMIISVLVMLLIPNLGDKSKEVNRKGCDALVTVVQAQADAYYIETNNYPETIGELKKEGYITDDQTKCPDNKTNLIIDTDGNVSRDGDDEQ
ncbi:prepilin-type N-terminal cleavage/methylation domain-containing protein [Lentibacillus cibarius]|uniref:ComG operon protein 3 n=1 Tax=Lentibacillus cibarius TaxID=2583219 RepID=A0A549YLD5_9BACI|nr:competence type IV pilus major pilin ComGC [Lentibacillus cibarius]TMN20958.1 prepilin-type N-terminal cleavage/methylation domain-containing protein [Lentibacillus cibarius]TRM12699.1 prepilin-type N-terminal cleavage/methylation domain-containing protein [Lentibacillus cibarius]